MMSNVQAICFHEDDPELSLWRRAGVEALGTLLLVLAGSGAGIAASRLFAAMPGLVLPLVAMALAGALVALIVALGSVSREPDLRRQLFGWRAEDCRRARRRTGNVCASLQSHFDSSAWNGEGELQPLVLPWRT